MARNDRFEEVAKAAGVPIYASCKCGDVFCQHDKATLHHYQEYVAETKGALLMWQYLRAQKEQQK